MHDARYYLGENSYEPAPESHIARSPFYKVMRIESLLDVLAGAAAVHLEAEVNVLLILGQMRVQAHSGIPGHS